MADVNDFREVSYDGPCPLSGSHRYYFHIYALDMELEIDAGANRKELEMAMQGHIIAEGKLMGKTPEIESQQIFMPSATNILTAYNSYKSGSGE